MRLFRLFTQMTRQNAAKATAYTATASATAYAAKDAYDGYRYEKDWHNAGYEKIATGTRQGLSYQYYIPGVGPYYKIETKPDFGLWKKTSASGEETIAAYDKSYKSRPEM